MVGIGLSRRVPSARPSPLGARRAVLRLGRRMARTMPLLSPPQKSRSPPSDSSPRHARAGRHVELLQNLARFGIDAPHIALVAFPGGVPQLAVDPGHAGDEAVGLDGAQDCPGLGVDLVDLALAVLPDPERPFGPGEPGIAAAAGCREWWPAPGRSSGRSSGCGPRRSGTNAGRQRRCRHARRHRSSARSSRSPDRSAFSLSPEANQTCSPSKVTPCTRSTPGKGPYSRRISAADRFMLSSL